MKRNSKGQFVEVEKKKVRCPNCDKEHKLYPSDYNRGQRYCSIECAEKAKSEKYQGENHWKYNRTETKCKICGVKFEHIPSKNRKYCSKSCSGKDREYPTGSDNPNWKGGKTNKVRKLRSSKEYSEWRTKVFERDDYTCQKCHSDEKFIHAHHKVSVSENIGLIFDVKNGLTVCADCHQKEHPELKLNLGISETNSNKGVITLEN